MPGGCCVQNGGAKTKLLLVRDHHRPFPLLPRTMILVPILNAVNSVYSTPLVDNLLHKELPGGKDGLPKGSSEFWWKMVMSAGLVLAGGLFAGCVW